jgi:hypothetical protein
MAQVHFPDYTGIIFGDASCATIIPRNTAFPNTISCVVRDDTDFLHLLLVQPGIGTSGGNIGSPGGPGPGSVYRARALGCVNGSFFDQRLGVFRNTTVCLAVERDSRNLIGIEFVNDTGLVRGTLQLGVASIDGDPSCAETEGGFVTCAWKTLANSLQAVRFNVATGGFSFEDLGGTIFGNPGCAPRQGGLQQVICVVRGASNALYGIRFNPSTPFSSGFQLLANGPFFGNPSCANSAGIGFGRVTCAVRLSDNSVFGFSTDLSGGLIQALKLGGIWVGDPSCAAVTSDRVICAGRNIRNTVEAIRFDPSTGFSSGFQNLGGVYDGDPICANSVVSQIACVAKNSRNVPLGVFFNP